MDKNTIIKVTNRDSGRVGYRIPELGVERQFTAKESKDITFDELERLSFIPGGKKMLTDYLVVNNKEALNLLGIDTEPEYFYTKDDVMRIMITGSLDEFLDCLDFAPSGVLDMIKDMAVNLPLNDMEKREAILNKLNFNVTRAIEIKNTKFDGDKEENVEEAQNRGTRRTTPVLEEASGRRVSTPKYKVVNTLK
jgi:hypothetical protein